MIFSNSVSENEMQVRDYLYFLLLLTFNKDS